MKARKDKGGPLTLTDLKQIPGIPSSLWDPLVQAKMVTLQEEDTQHENLPEKGDGKSAQEELENLKKNLRNIKTKLTKNSMT